MRSAQGNRVHRPLTVAGMAAALLAAGWCVQAAEVVSSGLHLVVDEKQNGAVSSLTDRLGNDFSCGPTNLPLWEIECRRRDSPGTKYTANASQAKIFSVGRIPGGLELRYGGLPGAVDWVKCTVRARGSDGAIAWRIEAAPTPDWALYETRYPVMTLSDSIGESPLDDCTAMGSRWGGVIRNPANPEREYWKNRLIHRFPGTLSSQWGAFWDGKGGLYTAAEDGDGHAKGLLLDCWWRKKQPDGSFKRGDFTCRWSRFNYAEETDTQPYDTVMRAFRGSGGRPPDWRDAADIYMEWAKGRRWCRTKLADRKDVPQWLKNGPLQLNIYRWWRREDVKAWLDGFYRKEFPGVPLVVVAEGCWEKNGAWISPDYFPCHPSDEKFRELCRWIEDAGGHVWAWPSGHHWNIKVGKREDGTYRLDYSEQFEREVAPHACAKEDGTPLVEKLSWLDGGESATLCPADRWSVDWWNEYVSKGLVERGVSIVQADQDLCATVADCWSRRHGHAPGFGRWMTLAMRNQFETMLETMRKIDPWAQCSFEEPDEFFNDLVSLQDYRTCRFLGEKGGDAWAATFNYLYHEYVTPFQTGFEFFGNWFWMAHSASDGQMARLPCVPAWYGPKADARQKAVVKFCVEWAHLYHENAKWLQHGKALHPPRIECDSVLHHEKFRYQEGYMTMPAVFHSAWRAADGSEALLLVNATDEERRAAIHGKGDGKKDEYVLAPHEIRLVR